MGEWSKLSAREKLDVIKFALANGVSDTNVIRDTYNIYKTGGNTKTGSGTRKITTNTKRRKTDMYFDSNRVLTNPVIEGGGQEYALTPSRVLQNVPLYTSFQITYDKDGNKIRIPYKKNPNVPWQDLRTMEELDYNGPSIQYVISPDGLTYTAYERRPGYSNAGYVKPVYETPEPVSATGILSNLNSSVAPVPAYIPEGGEVLKDGGKIHIAPSKRGTFTAAATKHGKSVQAFARQVLANKENYSPAMVKKANFARNFGGHKHVDGGYNLTSSPEAKLFLDDYAYRAALENSSITPDMVTSAISNLNFETRNREGIGGAYDYGSKTVYLPNINKWSQQAGHEIGGHYLRNELFGNMSAVSSDRAHMLEEALPNFYVPLEEVQKSRPLQERLATNTELRAAIIQNTGLSGKALDEYVNNMSDVDLLSLLYRKGNGYIAGSKVPFMRREVVLSNGQKANIDDYIDLQTVPEGHTAEDWLGISEEERQQLIREYQTLFDSNLTEEDRKQAKALRWTLLNVAQNNNGFQKSDSTYLAAFGGNLKSPGGLPYPFSFQKNPSLKTPVVRYDNGGAIGYQYGFGDWLKNLFSSKKEEEVVQEGLDYNELRRRQAYTESGFNNNAKSGAGAAGMFQIMPATLADYNAANGTSYTQKDLFNQDTNTAVRDWFVDSLSKRPWVTKGGANDSIQFAKVLAGYNFGAGNTVNALNKAKSNGVDIYNSWDWLDYVPSETKDYVNFILRNINNSISRNDSAYKAASLLNKEKVEKLK